MTAKVLYIEDNPDNMQLVQQVIESCGYDFAWASDGLSGLTQAERWHPDLILLDINLPDMDGYEVARRLRSSGSGLHATPIIAVTANALRGDADRALEAGCDVYMSKPIVVRELMARIMAFLPDAA